MSDEIDRERLVTAALKVLVRNARLPEWMQIDALGQDMRPLAELVVDAVLPEVQAWETAAERRGMDAVEKIFDEMWASNEYSDQMKPSMNFAADFAQGVDMAREAVTNP